VEVDRTTFHACPRLPDDVVAVAESGVRGPADVVAAPVEAGVRPDP
jgi:hypothetical protein